MAVFVLQYNVSVGVAVIRVFLTSVGTVLAGLPVNSCVVKAQRLCVVEDMGCSKF
jgi:hypothetical protein